MRKDSIGEQYSLLNEYDGDAENDDISFDDIVLREFNLLMVVCRNTKVEPYSINDVKHALIRAKSDWGRITIYDRVVPAGLSLKSIFHAIYSYRADTTNDCPDGIMLYHIHHNEWWRTDNNVENIQTDLGVVRQNINKAMQLTDINGRPFYLNKEEQIDWSKQQGGIGITSAEETAYLFLRSLYERNLPLWTFGSVRCRNSYGTQKSLSVGWYPSSGFGIGYYDWSDRCWHLGALSRKSITVSY